jgi:hypothetical protein
MDFHNLNEYPQVGLLDHLVVLFLGFSIMVVKPTFPSAAHKGSLFSTSSPTLVIFYLFDKVIIIGLRWYLIGI